MSREVEATAKLAPCPHCGELHDEDSLRCPATDMLLPLEGRRLDGKFRFLSSLGTGGMASVYLAVNERVDREVAIKFLRPEVGREPEAVARFRSEAKAAGRIGNRYICEILDLGESPIGPYIVMERLRGIDLAALIRRQGRLAPGYAVRVVRYVLEGLAAAHAAGIVHRDLKPGNIFLHRTESGDTIVKLMDFGVSKFLDGTNEAQTASGILLGTPEYMAPEQLEGAHQVGPPVDIWAIGAILYRAISGHQVFSGPNLAAVIKSMALDEVTPLSRLVEGLPPELEAVIHRCLDRDIAGRYASPEALSDALEPFEELDIEVVPIEQPKETTNLPISSIPIDGGAYPSGPSEPLSEPDTKIWEAGADGEPAPAAVQPAPLAERRGGTGIKVALGLVVGAALAFGVAYLQGPDQPKTEDVRPELPVGESGEGSEAPIVPRDLPAETETETETETEGTGETDTDTGTGEDAETGAEGDGDGDDGGSSSWVASTGRPAPSGTFRVGPYIAPNEPGANTDLPGAKARCAGLAAKTYAGQKSWKLANPSQLAKFIGSNKVKRGRYWTTALNRGRAWTYSMPGGKKSSEKADRKIARALCLTKY